jgi:hypothetical protein
VPLPGLSTSRDDHDAPYPWTPRLNEQLSKWQDRSSPCERPRTYDKFYQKLPGNYQVEKSKTTWLIFCSFRKLSLFYNARATQ